MGFKGSRVRIPPSRPLANKGLTVSRWLPKRELFCWTGPPPVHGVSEILGCDEGNSPAVHVGRTRLRGAPPVFLDTKEGK